ncbi:hypothetical protein A2348_00940 [Candidatus Uhrbacteria bacterium RIFOXYB12_FULL_58_10]|uniref:SbsA Ig-like domain-containing protein n=1 Tax=Candidatus Uhrbacteria bacterium RIFOXYB2_FULL_57_15 TaxID=1802422 RepID=A0A1F7W7S9_9BACT|nr:MAG: hypothetical protein A2348_00940 [Candidatus Uhrbacteria bacterium RIFOXYB12_FULL_58_10]OGL98852.1 MAG: hypothetical protein A2304_03825 [Candidatus Uhrbacteria bacterium RIFOXYB2_FULL_57_15]OGM00213.1 MAG: hypothetical protein A2501_01585 [Candidatus Uhrbacteria bacterium RIFOXYC12_FULL_57_11]
MRFKSTNMRNRIFAGAALCVLSLCVLSVAHPVLAQSATDQLEAVAAGGGLPTANIGIMIARVIRVFLGTLGIIFTIVVLYAGFIYMTAQGDPDKIKKAKDMIKNGVIGMIICLSAFSITQFILNRLLSAAGAGGSISSIADQYGEPLSGSLGAGIIDSHYPERNAIDIPRNTRIMVTFKQAINPASIISGYATSSAATDLNADNILIYPTAEGDGSKLAASEVLVTTNDEHTIFVFDPVPLLGDGIDDVNYTVALSNDIELEDGGSAFSGNYSGGYEWTFEVSTEVDLTPPKVVSVIPRSLASAARNVTVSITFNEAMDPVASTGTYAEASSGNLTNIEVLDGSGNNVEGTFAISNGYKTLEFTPVDACGEDPCGDTIYCLPGSDDLTVQAHAASLTDEPPQAQAVGVSFDGLVDAAANSLDGDGDGKAQGSSTDDVTGTDDYAWSFETTSEIDDTVPAITDMSPGIGDTFADQDADIEITFNVAMRSSTLNTSNVSLWPDPWYEFWFSTRKTDVADEDGDTLYTTAQISHPTMVSSDDEGWMYFPVVTRGVKSNAQICMFPAYGPDESGTGVCDVTEAYPYCCDGVSSDEACPTSVEGVDLPDTSE